MTDKIIDLEQYKAKIGKLRQEAEQEKEEVKRTMLLAICDWYDLKCEEYFELYEKSEIAFDELERLGKEDVQSVKPEREKELLKDTLAHFEFFGRLAYIHHGINVIKTEGEFWQNNKQITYDEMNFILDPTGR